MEHKGSEMDGTRWTVGVFVIGLVIGVVVGLLTRDVILAIIASAGLVAVVMQGPRLYRLLWAGDGRHAGMS